MFQTPQDLLEKILIWKRYIDDVFMLFKGSAEECTSFVEGLNKLMPGAVKFKFEYSRQKIEFLDLEIMIENGLIETNLYIKPANLQLYLDYFSNHPEPCKEGIVYSQALRIVERCSKEADVEKQLDNLKEKLEDRSYPTELIDRKFKKAKEKKRNDLIFQTRKKKTDDKIRLIFTHNQGNPPLHQWLREAKRLLVRNDKAKKMGDQMQVAFRQPKNMKKIVTQNNLVEEIVMPTPSPGCFKCGKCKVACPILKEGSKFSSTNTKKVYRIKQHVNCNSTFVIYLGTCQKCQGQYVGKTTREFKKRHSGHKQEVKNCIGGLGHHYGSDKGCGYKNVRIQIIEQVELGNEEILGEREVYWQHQLRCYVENGGGAHCYRKEL